MDNQVTEQLLDWVRNRFFGKYRGLVTDNNDPTNRGRLKVKVPAVHADVEVWAMPCLPYGGNNVGVYMVPEPGAGVWVEFEAGDTSFPIWTGTFWADDELPKDNNGTHAVPSLRIIRSEKGLMISMNDQSEVITVSDENGKNFVTIEVVQGKIKIKGNLKVIVEAPQIELVENATHPVPFGDELFAYLTQIATIYAAHTHPGEMALGILPVTPAPPVPPFLAPPSSMLSIKVRTG